MIIGTSIAERQKALYPELFMTAEEKANFTANMVGTQAVDQNSLGQTADTLWSVIAPEALDAVTKKYFNLGSVNHVVETNIIAPAGVRPTVNVEVVTGAGTALKNATDWNASALTNTYAEVKLDRYSAPFGLSSYDIMHGEKIETKIAAAVESVVSRVMNDFLAAVLAASGTQSVTIAADTFDPSFVAQNISAIFGDYGPVDDLVLSPTYWARIIPTDALGLGTEPGTYGIEHFHRSAGFNATVSGLTDTANLHGLALRKNGIVAGFGTPSFEGMQGIAVRNLGTVAGVPLVLKSWTATGSEVIYNSVETLAGFSVANAASIAKLVTASADAGSDDDDTPADPDPDATV